MDDQNQVAVDDQDEVDDDLITIDDNGSFTCIECQNEVQPKVTGESGAEDADLTKVKSELTADKAKMLFSFCPVCGMEYQFKLTADGDLKLQASDEEK